MMCFAQTAREVLDGTANPACQVEVRGDLGAGLADLHRVRAPALRGHHAGNADDTAEQSGELFKRSEPVGAADTAAATDHDAGGRERGTADPADDSTARTTKSASLTDTETSCTTAVP